MVDVDGTVAETYTTNLLPGVQEFFHLVFYGTCPHSPQIALATNQGGVGLRRWMETAGFGEPDKYPTLEDIESRLAELSSLLAEGKKLNVYASFSYQSHQGQWSPIPKGMEQDLPWSYEWRKPGPGMLLQAMQEAGVKPEKNSVRRR